MPTDFRPILRNEAALTILPTGVVKIRESKKVFDRALDPNEHGDDAERSKRAQIAFRHESVHFIQAFTTGYVLKYCEDVRLISVSFAYWLKDKKRDRKQIGELTSLLTEVENDLDRVTGHDPTGTPGVSARQLMEAAAVVESIRSLRPNATFAEVFAEIPKHTDPNETYTRVLNIANKTIGPGPTIRLVPAMIFIALNTEKPGASFCEMIVDLLKIPAATLAAFDLGEVFDRFGRDLSRSVICAFAKGNRISKSPFWNDVGTTFASSGPLDLLHRVAAYPSSLLSKSSWSEQLNPSIARCVPPLMIFEDGQGLLSGLAKKWSAEQITGFLYFNELVGTMYRMGTDRKYETLCQHTDCPSRANNLCHMAYPPPPAETWHECPFRKRFYEIAGEWPENFAKIYGLV